MNLTPIDFDSFHDATRAVFTICATPTREPDHISESRSTYWDEAGGVVRLSDHWAGQHDCTSQRSCIWSIDTDLAWGRAAAGWCAYTAFVRRRRVPVWHTVSPEDRDLAARLMAGRGAIPAGEWTVGQGKRTRKRALPPWATEETRGGPDPSPAAARLFGRSAARIAVTALRTDVPRRIAGGAGRVKVGETWS